jgi:hypothetical protein
VTVEFAAISADAYHADPWAEPSLNATVAASLVLETPAHAREKHPRLATTTYKRNTDALDEGTAIHQMLLGDDRCDILDFDAFRSNDAKEARDASRAAGRTPILQKKWDELLELGDSLKRQVADWPIDPPLFVDGLAEQTILWDEDGVRFRARLDWLRSDLRTIDDLKKSRTAKPRKFHAAVYGYGYDIKAAFYIRAVRAAFGVDIDPVFRWVAIEPTPPYAMSVHVLSPQALRNAHASVDLAVTLWKECLETDTWPAYGQQVNVVELPGWMQAEEWDDTALTEVPF